MVEVGRTKQRDRVQNHKPTSNYDQTLPPSLLSFVLFLFLFLSFFDELVFVLSTHQHRAEGKKRDEDWRERKIKKKKKSYRIGLFGEKKKTG